MDRRDLLRRLALSGAGAATAPAWLQAIASIASGETPVPAVSTAPDWAPRVLDAHQDRTVVALAEAIIPRTDTPGATDALVNRYVDAVLADGDEHERKAFTRGLQWMDDRSRALFAADFVEARPDEQAALLTILGSGRNRSADDQAGVEFFEDMKKKTIVGYYTSEAALAELGEDTTVFHLEFKGCTHPEHGWSAPPADAPRPRKKG